VTRKWLAGGAFVALALAAVGIAIARRSAPKSIAAPAHAVESQPANTVPADLTGRVQPRTIVAVAAPREGVIEAFYVEPGQPVIKDQLLGKIRSPKLEAAAQQAQFDLDQTQARVAGITSDQLAAKLELSRATADQSRTRADAERLENLYQRQKNLWDEGAIPRLTFEKSEKEAKESRDQLETLNTVAKAAAARVEQLGHDLEAASQSVAEKTAALDRAKADLNSGELHSPADGILVARHGDVGQPVDPSTQDVLQIATDLTQLQAFVSPPAEMLPRIHPGQPAIVRVGDTEYTGTVTEIRGAEVVIDFTVPTAITRLDLTAQVRIKV
jgi:HlyD family secretion protein